jgi:hypothetical protein
MSSKPAHAALAISCFALVPPAAAQDSENPDSQKESLIDAPSSETAGDDTLPIVVTGRQEEKREVLVGSRIARKPIFEGGSVATSTGVNGLTPQSGMDPSGRYTRAIRETSCEASDERISEDVACTLFAAKGAMENEDWLLVRGLLVPVARNTGLSGVERRAASDYLYFSAQSSGDLKSQIEALEVLVNTQTLSDVESGKAFRSLSSLSIKAGDEGSARKYLLDAIRFDPDHYMALSNLTILQRNSGDDSASDTMEEAIASAEREGKEVPEAWRSFVSN